MMQQKILLLEDDVTLNETIQEYLEENNYEVQEVFDANEANEAIYESSFDLFILDVNVPFENGFELLKKIRDQGIKTPAIYITSLNSVESLETGYESGADDYIRKPFALKELLLRVESILKRSYYHQDSAKLQITQEVSFDTQDGTLYDQDKQITLNTKEIKLLKLFLQNKNIPLSHEKIYDTLWDYDQTPSDESLRTYIKNLRKHIGKEKIVSIKKVGYKFI